MEMRRLIPSPLPKKIVLLPLFLDISTPDENITKKIVLADHQLNEDKVEAVPAEGVEELPEAIILFWVTVQNLTAQSQKYLLSREREHRLFSGLGLFVVLGMCAAVFVVKI